MNASAHIGARTEHRLRARDDARPKFGIVFKAIQRLVDAFGEFDIDRVALFFTLKTNDQNPATDFSLYGFGHWFSSIEYLSA
jgi:hypothetical protein